MQIPLHLHSEQRHIYFSKTRKRIIFLRDIIFMFLDKEIKIWMSLQIVKNSNIENHGVIKKIAWRFTDVPSGKY